MGLALEIQELSSSLPESKQRLVLEVIKGFMHFEEVTPYDAELIAAAEEDLANGETVSHDEINWE
jgi:predicted transcriptional regulator